MNKSHAGSNLAKNTLQELWAIKDETAESFGSVSAYFEHLKATQKLQSKITKNAILKTGKVQPLVKHRLAAAVH
jgi:hypothetical protein